MKFLGGNLIDASRVLGIMREAGVDENGFESWSIEVLFEGGIKIKALEISFTDEEVDVTTMSEEQLDEARQCRDAMVLLNMTEIARFLGFCVDQFDVPELVRPIDLSE